MLNYSMAKKVNPNFKPPRQRTFFKEWRKHRNMTLEQAGEAAGMTAGNISAMERGSQNYTQEGLERLAVAYDCQAAHLIMVNPLNSEIWSIWEIAKPADRQKIVDIAKTIVGKTGTGG